MLNRCNWNIHKYTPSLRDPWSCTLSGCVVAATKAIGSMYDAVNFGIHTKRSSKSRICGQKIKNTSIAITKWYSVCERLTPRASVATCKPTLFFFLVSVHLIRSVLVIQCLPSVGWGICTLLRCGFVLYFCRTIRAVEKDPGHQPIFLAKDQTKRFIWRLQTTILFETVNMQ
jgi:hypothetical protein